MKLHLFCTELNAVDPEQFVWTFEHSTTEIAFLDIRFEQKAGVLDTFVHRKPLFRPQYLQCNSDHSKHVKAAICKSQFFRFLINNSTALGYELDVLYLRQQLVLRGYPEGIVVAPKYDPAARIQHLMRFQSKSKRNSKSWDKIVLTLPFARKSFRLEYNIEDDNFTQSYWS